LDSALTPTDVVTFWRNAGPKKWFAKDDAFDRSIREGFEALHMQASTGALSDWAETAEGVLALLILLDQFPRNLYRGSAHAFATDPKARAFALTAVDKGFDREVEPILRNFFYLPFEHSERLADQDYAVALCTEAGDADNLKWASLHRDIIVRFGRFPHRNQALGRVTTPQEQEFLDEGGFAG